MRDIISLDQKVHDTNPVSALIVVVVAAILMIVFTTTLFLRSDAFNTVKQIQAGIKATDKSDLSNYDTTTPVKSEDIDNFSKNLELKLAPINNENDYSASAVDYGSLGIK